MLVNSPGPHDRVRVTEPFALLKSWGIDIRVHQAPFHLPTTIRPHSLVIWQRPLPDSEQQQIDVVRWIRDQGCILITEWDDHIDLFPKQIQKQLRATNGAALKYCHLIQTSSIKLQVKLKTFNMNSVVLENSTGLIPQLNLNKHEREYNPRIFIGNLNRHKEHKELIQGLNAWCRRDQSLRLVVIQDRALAMALPDTQIEFHTLSAYEKYRSLLRGCHMALLPLSKSDANECKTPIKWIEAAAESVLCIGGPELYSSSFSANERGILVEEGHSIALVAEHIWEDRETRCRMVSTAHEWVRKHHNLTLACLHRLWMYKHLWRLRAKIDKGLLLRHPQAATTKRFEE